jgi:hypothetical protein
LICPQFDGRGISQESSILDRLRRSLQPCGDASAVDGLTLEWDAEISTVWHVGEYRGNPFPVSVGQFDHFSFSHSSLSPGVAARASDSKAVRE